MVKANINRTLKAIMQKKYWDGRDAGRMLLYDMARARDQQKKKKEPTPVYPPDEFNARVNALPVTERLQYRMYEGISETITRFTASYGLYRMGLFYDFLLYQSKIEMLQAKDEAKRDANDEPIIMTQKQFDREYTLAVRENKAVTVSYYDLLILEIINALKRKEGALFDDVLDEVEPLRNEKATDPVMLQYYNRQADRGYYEIRKTGLRSDQTDVKTWDDAVAELMGRLAARIIKLEMGLRSMPEPKASALAAIGRYRRYRAMEYLYNGGNSILTALRENGLGEAYTGPDGLTLTPDEVEYTAAKVIDTLPVQAIYVATPNYERTIKDWHTAEDLANLFIYGGAAPVWHYYDDPPADLNKYDLLYKCVSLYGSADGNRCYGSEQAKVTAFKKEFPKLYEAALREVERKVGKLADGTDVTEPILRLGTLQRNKDIDQDSLAAIFEERKPEMLREMERRGVAVMEEKLLDPETIDKRGNYKSRVTINKEWRDLLRNLEHKEDDRPRDIIKQNILPDAVGYLIYNQMIDIFAEVADVPLLTVFKSNTDELEEAAQEVNKKIFSLIHKTYAGTRRDAARREDFRAHVRQIFKPINLNLYYATPAELEPIRHEVKAFITPPHIYKGERVLPIATAKHVTYGLFHMAMNLRSSVERRCKK